MSELTKELTIESYAEYDKMDPVKRKAIESHLFQRKQEKKYQEKYIKKVIIDVINFGSLGFIRTKILPFAIVALFGIAFFAVSARIWLPGDMMSPAPIN